MGQYDKAAAEEREALRLLADSSPPVVHLMIAYMALNRPQEAKNVYDEAVAHGVDDPQMRWIRYRLGFVQGDPAVMQEQVTLSKQSPKMEDWILSQQAASASYMGRMSVARKLSWRAVQSASDAGREESSAIWWARQSLVEAEIGNGLHAAELAKQALARRAGVVAETTAALTFARVGNISDARSLAEKLDREFPADTMLQNYSLPTIHALIEMAGKDPQKAINILQATVPYGMGDNFHFGDLLPVYVQGEAYLQAGHAQEAAAAFKRVLDHPGIVVNFVTGALAHLQLGRAQVMMGDMAAARKSYQDFLTLWKDADPDIPIYKEAKTEYAKLH
jgi:tetratricopeptide (TPR) repeat protein